MRDYRLYEGIDQVPLDQWREAAGNNCSVFMEPGFVRSVERALPDQARIFHALLYQDDGRPAGCASFCLLPVDLFLLAGSRLQAVAAGGRRLIPTLGRVNVLLCGLPVSAGQNHLAFAPGVDRQGAIIALDRLMHRLAREQGCRFLVWKEFGDEDCADLDLLCQRGYYRAASPAAYEMENRFAGFAAYRAALNAHYRRNIKRCEQKFARAGCRAVSILEPEAILQAYTPDVHRLYEAVVERSAVKLEILPQAFFHELVRQLPGLVRLNAVYRQNRIVAFGWCLAASQEYHCLFGGVDYALNGECDLYFNMVYHSLDNAFQHGGRVIHAGQTADSFKANLGLCGKPRYFYVRGTGHMVSWLLKRMAQQLFPPRPPLRVRKIFKRAGSGSPPL
jgi:hypothetical protein